MEQSSALATNISQEDIDTYQRDGAVLIKNVLDAASLALLKAGIEEAYERQTSRTTRVDAEPGAGETTVLDYASEGSESLRKLLDKGVLGQIGARLMQTRSAHLILDQVFHKAAGPIVATPWHQDTPFLRVRGNDLIRLWSPLDFSPRSITVQVVRGSHRWNVVWSTKLATAKAKSGDASKDERGVGDPCLPTPPDVARYRDSFDILSWDVEPGDVLAFQGNMLHGTDGLAEYNQPRRAFAVLLGGPDLQYHSPEGKAFPTPGRVRGLREKDDIPDAAPIGEYESAFPACWRAGEGAK